MNQPSLFSTAKTTKIGNSIQIRIPRNEYYSTPEMVFNDISRGAVSLYLSGVQAYRTASGTQTPMQIGMEQRYAQGPSARPLLFQGVDMRVSATADHPFSGLTEKSGYGLVTLVAEVPDDPSQDAIFATRSNWAPIEIVNDFDRSYATRAGYISSDAYMAGIMFHETGHEFLNEKFGGSLGGHAEVGEKFLTEGFGDISAQDIRNDSVTWLFEHNASSLIGILSNDGSNWLEAKIESFNADFRSIYRKLPGSTPAEKIEALRKSLLKSTSSYAGGVFLPVNTGGDPSFLDIASDVLDGIRTIDGAQIGLALGSVLGKRILANPFERVVASGALSTFLGAAGEFLDKQLGGTPSTAILEQGLNSLSATAIANIKGAGVGALSSYLTAELFQAIGLKGVPAETANSVGGSVVSQVLTNLSNDATRSTPFAGVNASLVVNAIGSYIGTKLASEIKTFDTVGGQIGSATGTIVGGFTSTVALGAIQGVELTAGASLSQVAVAAAQFAALNPIAAVAIVAAIVLVETLLGGLIGSIFGGVPRSGADAEWDGAQGAFVTANIYSKHGGSKDAARQMAAAVAGNLNAVLSATGSTLLDPTAVQSGNYGMRKKDYVYRPNSTRDKDAITARFTSSDGAQSAITHGSYLGIESMLGQLAGGDIYVKRASVASLMNAGGNPTSSAAGAAGHFDMTTLLGDVSTAGDFENYLQNSTSINALMAADPTTSFSVGWLATLAHAVELGLNRRSTTDWTGGYAVFLDEAGDGAIDKSGLGASQLHASLDPSTGLRYWSISGADGNFLGFVEDTIEAHSATVIAGGSGADIIKLTGDMLLATSGSVNAGLTVGNVPSNGQATKVDVAASIDAGAGDDRVEASDLGDNVLGGLGNDALYGGRLDDWLMGGDGNDAIDAGSAILGTLGGDGNYLDGGAGDDILRGREGSDWLEGGDGVDTLTGGAGDDVLAGGVGTGDSEKGGSGSDQYIVRRGDGADLIEEDATDAPISTGAGDAITQRLAAIAAGTVRRDWIGTFSGVTAGTITGGDDALVFGQDIELGDLKLQRSGTSTAVGNDLIVIVNQTVNGTETDSGTRVTIKDWFSNPFKRVEWLKFIDGTEVRIGDLTTFIVGGSGSDYLIGTGGNDFVYGGAGNDKLLLLAGDDLGNGGTGDDMVAGGSGRDIIVGGLGNDEVIGGKGADALTGDAGTDDLYGGDDNDTLSGGRGDGDQVVGGAGDDTFKFSRGDGRDTVFDDYVASGWSNVYANGGWATGYTYNSTTGEVTGPDGSLIRKNMGSADLPDLQWLGRYDYDDATGILRRYTPPASGTMVANNGNDTLEFALGINIQDVILRRVGNDLVLAVSNDASDVADTSTVADSVTIKDWYVTGLTGEIEKFAFYQTGVLDVAAGKTNLIAGTDGNDGTSGAALAGSSVADWITGAAGDDIIAGGTGADILAGDAGSDILRGEGDDDILYGGTGNDQLDGGKGKDVLIGGSGTDVASYASATAGVRAQLSASATNSGDADGDQYDSIEGLIGGSGGDVLGGDTAENELTGGLGSDMLLGGAGDDTYVWNAGDGADVIHEGAFAVEEAVTVAGALANGYATTWSAAAAGYWRLSIKNAAGELVYDYASYTTSTMPTPSTYVQSGWLGGFKRTNTTGTGSSAQQVTREQFDSTVDGGSDVLQLGQGLSFTDLTFVWGGSDLYIQYSSTQQIKLQDQKLAFNRVEILQLADGQAVALSSVLIAKSVSQVVGTAGDDLIVGQSGAVADNLAGADGNDILVGYAGDDQLFGAAGDDVLEGGLGADRLDGGTNTAIGTTTSAGDTVRYVRSTAAVTIDLSVATAQSGGDAAGDTFVDIENVVGSAYNDVLTGNSGGNRLSGLDGNDTIDAAAGDDVLLGDGGDDILYGRAGIDNIAGGDGNDTLWGGTEDDRLDGGDGADKLYGEDGKDSLTAGAGNDIVDGGAGDDTLVGDLGDDSLTGGDGNDILDGGVGSDTLAGGVGGDSYVFTATSGTDTVVDASGVNFISFDKSVTYDKLWMTRSGNDLRVAVIGGSATITVTGFFAASNPSLVRAIQTQTHAYYLDNADSLALVKAMTDAGVATPPAMPSTVSNLLPTYWHAGGKAAPTSSTSPRVVTIAEDTPIAIGGGYAVVDHDGGTLTYSLKPDALPSLGTITGLNPATGALTYTPNANANGAEAFSLLATDSDGQSVELKVAITITPVNDAPGVMSVAGGGTLSVVESGTGTPTAAGTVVGQLSSIDPDGNFVYFSLVDDAGGRFQITTGGQLTVKSPTLLDYEVATSHQIQVKASDNQGGDRTQTMTVSVANLNELNALPATYAMAVNENVAIGTAVGTVAATDIDSAANAFGQQRYYFLNGSTVSATSSDGRYSIDAVAGAIKSAAALDFEAATPSKTYQVVARDNAGNAPFNQTNSNVTIAIVNANEVNSLPVSYALSVAENVALGTVVGTIKATDLDAASDPFGQQRYYFLVGTTASATTADGRYAIDAASGVITTKSALNYEGATPSVTYQVIARDNAGNAPFNQASSSVTVGIADRNDPNALPATYAMQIAENVAVGTAIGTIKATDEDGASTSFAQQRYYFLNGTTSATSSDGRYSIDATTGIIKSNAALDFEAGTTSVTYTVVARDNAAAAGFYEASTKVTIGITDVNEAPTAIAWSPTVASVAERDRIAAGTARDAISLGTFGVTDPDTSGSAFATYVYTVSDSRFEFVGNALRLKQNASLDFEAGPAVSLIVTGKDTSSSPLSIQKTISIAVTNIDDVLEGDANANVLTGQQNTDIIYGYGGNDAIDGGAGNDTLNGGAGSDRLLGSLGNDILYGNEDDDVIVGGAGQDTLYGGANASLGTYDRLYGGDDADTLFGEAGDDYLSGGAGADKLDGGDGSDWADYSLLDESVAATSGISADLAGTVANTGVASGDTYVSVENILGSGFDDALRGDANANVLRGNAGNDTLDGRAGDDDLGGGAGNDSLYGGDGADLLNGDDGDDIIYGGAGNDRLYGGAGNDQLFAESGDDMLDGGAGDDILNGGTENDTYLMTRTSGADTIVNYDPSGADVDVLGLQDSAGTINDQDIWFERSGNDMIVSIVGANSSERIKDWYTMAGVDGANYKIDFIVAGTRYTKTINVEGLVALMATKTKPTTTAQRDALMSDTDYKAKWATAWGTNAAPTLSAIATQTIAEDGTLSLTIVATDDITPANGISLSGEILSGGNVVPLSGLTFGAADSSGNRSLTIKPATNVAGAATIRIRATDAGGVTSYRDFTINVTPVADKPTIAGFVGGSGTSGVGVPLTINVDFPDKDGSELQELWITGVPAAVTLSAGTYDSANAIWKLTPAQTAGLVVKAPAGWSQDLNLTLTARATEGGQTVTSTATTSVVLNAPPTAITLTGTVSENAANGTAVGTASATDPDGDTLSYSLTDNASGRFAINASTGAITVLNGALLDFEATASHNVTVRATDRFGQMLDKIFAIAVTNVNETPNLPVAGAAIYLEETGWGRVPANAGVVAASFSLSDPDRTTPALVLTGSSTNWFVVDGSTVKVKAGVNLDFEWLKANGYTVGDFNGDGRSEAKVVVTAKASDGSLASGEATTAVYIQNSNENPNAPVGPASVFFDETGLGSHPVGPGSVVATFSVSDPDGTTPTLQLSSQTYDWFYIDGNTVRVRSDLNFDFEALAYYFGLSTADVNGDGRKEVWADFGVTATDGAGTATSTSTETKTRFYISDVNERPNALSMEANNVFSETLAGDTHSGRLQTRFGLTDPDATVPELVITGGNANNWFKVNGAHIQVNDGVNWTADWLRANKGTLGVDSAFNYDTDGDGLKEIRVATLTVAARDAAGLMSDSFTYNVLIEDVNEKPNPLVVEANNTFSETFGSDSHSGRLLTRFGMTDPDGTVPGLVILSGNDNGWFHVAADNKHVQISDGVNWTADWLRANKGKSGVDADFYYDNDGDGLKEIRVATLTVASRDAGGLQSDSYQYNVYIEDVNEAPTFTKSKFNILMNENPASYQTVAKAGDSDVPSATDIDGPSSDLRYAFNGVSSYRDSALNRNVTKSADGLFVMDDNGNIFVNGSQVLNFEQKKDFAYDIMVFDRAYGANSVSSAGKVGIHLQDVDEGHTVNSMTANVLETNASGNPYAYNVDASAMVQDPEGRRNIHYQFTNGQMTLNGWQIEASTGHVWYTGMLDYEGLTRWTTETLHTRNGEDYSTYEDHYDPSRATFSLGINAFDDVNGVTASGTLTVNVQDVNEAPTFTGAIVQSLREQKISETEYWISSSIENQGIIQLTALDPERGGAVSYSISDQTAVETYVGTNSDSHIDATGLPSVRVDANGLISFTTPGEAGGNAWWEGGTAIGGRHASKVRVTFNLNITDASGLTSKTPFSIAFLSRGATAWPIVLDLDGDGIEMTEAETSLVKFDMDGDGVRDTTGWVGADDGLLVLDRNNNGMIDDINEISFKQDDPAALSDVEGLRAFDTNDNGYFDAGDRRFNEFQIWQDTNQDGVSQVEELLSLTQAGITSINLTISLNPTDIDDALQNRIYATSTFQRADGTEAIVGDVALGYEPEGTDALAAPIIFDLDRDGQTITTLSDSATQFDITGDGNLRRTAWADKDDAFLVRDRNGNGLVDNIQDISFVGDKAGAKTDLEGLAGFDDNGDGVLDADDVSFVGFSAWIDANSNGVTDAGELRSLAQAGITSIDLNGTSTGQTADTRASGQSVIFNTADFHLADGTSGSLSDVGLAYDTTIVGQPGAKNVAFDRIVVSSDKKARGFGLTAANGTLTVRPRTIDGTIDPAAGRLDPSTLLAFDDRSVGYLNVLVLDLDGDGFELKSLKKSRATFDMDGDGVRDDTGWIGGGDALLVLDTPGAGAIKSPNAISLLAERTGTASALGGLGVLDSNKDGRIDSSDSRFAELKVWKDADHDGTVDGGELKALGDVGIASLSLTTTNLTGTASVGNNVGLATASFTRKDGSISTLGEAALAFTPSSFSSHGSLSDALAGIPKTAFQNAANDISSAASSVQSQASRLIEAMGAFGTAHNGADELSLPYDRNEHTFALAAAH